MAASLVPDFSDYRDRLESASIRPTGLNDDDYLSLVSGVVHFFRRFQEPDGRICDPYVLFEVQYSTPCYAWAAASLVASGREPELLDSAVRALECSLRQLADCKAADKHGDFFMFPSMLAYETLDGIMPEAARERCASHLRAINPYEAYDRVDPDSARLNNHNVVTLAGEFLRSRAGFTDTEFVERFLSIQLGRFSNEGLYEEKSHPMASDHLPRHCLAVVLQKGYGGPHRARLEKMMDEAAWLSLLMQSPCGELPTGGRSAQHQWNEAMQCVTFEVWARAKRDAGDIVAARAYKRAARLALKSVRRWVRPSGELWIVKNRFDPAMRHGYENYSFHSQYNLLAASMLATAWMMSDEEVEEGPCPADVGGFVLRLEEFHKVIANAGGLYVEIDTAADPLFNSTGLLRLHRTEGEPLVGPSDGTAIKDAPLAVGVAWKERDRWRSLAEMGADSVKDVDVVVKEVCPSRVVFTVRYHLACPPVTAVVEEYELTSMRAKVTATVEGDVASVKVRFPAMAFDGQQASVISVDGSHVSVLLGGARQVFRVEGPGDIALRRSGQWVPSRNGYLEAIEGEAMGNRIVYTLNPKLPGTSSGRLPSVK